MKKIDSFFVNVIDWCFTLLFFFTPLLFTWFNEELFEFNKMLFVYAMSLIALAAWVARMVIRRRFSWQKTVFDIPIGGFLLSQLLSTLFSIHPETSIFGYYTRFHGGLLSTLAYVTLFAVFTQTALPKQIWKYFQVLAISSIIVSAIAIPEHLGHSLSCVFINSSHLSETEPLSSVLNPQQLWRSYNAQCWVQDVQSRVFATFGQPNWLAAYAIVLLPVFIVLTALRKKKEQWLYAIASIGLFLDLLFTKSRSGILGLGVAVAWLICVFLIWRIFSSSKKVSLPKSGLKSSAIIISVLVGLAIFFGTPYTPSISQFFESKSTVQQLKPVANRLDIGGTDSGEIRKIVWTGAVDIWKKYPVLGSGVETFAYSYNQSRPMAHNNVSEWDFLYNKAHNEFLNFLATTGSVGLLAYLLLLAAFIGFPVLFTLKNHQLSLENGPLFLSLSAGLVGLTVSNALGFSTVMVTVLFFFYPAVTWVLNRAESASPALAKVSSNEELSFREKLWVGVVGLALLVGLILVWRTWRADYLFARGKVLNQKQEYLEGVTSLEHAYSINREPIFAEELAEIYGMLSNAFLQANEATAAAQYNFMAQQKADEILERNPHNLNFYKTRTRVLASLSPQDPQLLIEAESTLNKAAELAPTDPKVRYNLGLVKLSLGKNDEAEKNFEQAIEMKPNYEEARISLAQLKIDKQELQQAVDQYKYILEKIQPENKIARQEVARLEAILATASAKPNQTQTR